MVKTETANALPYFRDLDVIRTRLNKAFGWFPTECCAYSSRVVASVLRDDGIQEAGGHFVPMNRGHYWNYDPERRLYIDITLNQFGDYPEIAILPITTELLSKTNEKTETQRTREMHYLDKMIQELLAMRFR